MVDTFDKTTGALLGDLRREGGTALPIYEGKIIEALELVTRLPAIRTLF